MGKGDKRKPAPTEAASPSTAVEYFTQQVKGRGKPGGDKPKPPTVPKRERTVKPTRERFQHDVIVKERRALTNDRDGVDGSGTGHRVKTQTPLDRCKHKRVIDWRQHRAGQKFLHQWQAAGVEPNITGGYSVLSTSGGSRSDTSSPAAERRAIAHSDWKQSVRAIGPQLSEVAISVTCQEMEPADWALKHGYPARDALSAGIAVLKLALDGLADHYGI